MRSFMARRDAGEEWAGMYATRIEGRQLNWMRPTPLGGMCATCHGDPASFTQDTRLALGEAYPDDQATDFNFIPRARMVAVHRRGGGKRAD